jgi:hypothetical protein
MRIRDWQDVLEDVVESDAQADRWRAAAGDRRRGIGEDMYLGHPDVGVFQIKTYARNPYEVEGVGSRVARQVDDEIEPLFPGSDAGGRFGVRRPVENDDEAEETASRLEEVVRAHADAPTTPDALFEDVMGAVDSPAYGPMEYDQYDRPDRMDELADTFEEAEELLEKDFEDVIEESGVDHGFQ